MSDEVLEKSWKKKMIGALGAAAFANPIGISPDSTVPEQDRPAPVEQIEDVNYTKPSDYDVDFGQSPVDEFLYPISMLESSGGKNTNHETVDYGLHEGDTAIGKFALMPKTVRNVAGMLNSKNSILRTKLGPQFKDEELQSVAKLPEDQIEKVLKQNPKLARRTARYLAEHVLELNNGDMNRAAYGWRFGHNRPPEKVTDKMLSDSGYVKKFNKFKAKSPFSNRLAGNK